MSDDLKRLTDPIENLRCYIMVHGGIDRHERLLDVEWVEDVIRAAKRIDREIGLRRLGEDFDWPELVEGRNDLHSALSE